MKTLLLTLSLAALFAFTGCVEVEPIDDDSAAQISQDQELRPEHAGGGGNGPGERCGDKRCGANETCCSPT